MATTDQSFDFAHNRAPIYIQLSTIFRRLIVNGQWPVDRQIPTHDALAAQFEVNSATIRKAIAILEQEGLVARFRGHGTFVTAKPTATDWLAIPTSWYAATSAFEGLDVELVSSHPAAELLTPFHAGGRLAAAYHFTRRLYRRNRQPVVVEESFVDAALHRETETTAPRTQLAAMAVRAAEETILFRIADNEISALLAVPLNAPLAIVHQSVRGDGDVLLCQSKLYFRGDVARVSEPIRFAAVAR